MTTSTRTEASAKKDVTKLQRAIVDGLEDVKAQDIQVFNTEKLSPLFERVIVASGTSNRQTKALATSVRDAVRDAGFGKPRMEGEDNGEWIIVDCGAAVAHIMQPAIRQYYRLEELWGDTPVRLKLGAAKPQSSAATELAEKKSAQKAAKSGAKATAKKAAAPTVAARSGKATVKAVAKTAAKTAAKTPVKAAPKPAAKTTAKAAPAKTVAKTSGTVAAKKPAAPKTPVKTVVVKPGGAKKPAAKKSSPAAKTPARAAAKPASAAAPKAAASSKPAAAKKAPARKG